MTLEATEKECAAVAIAPRVSLSDIEAAIAGKYWGTADQLVGPTNENGSRPKFCATDLLKHMTVCVLIMRNGFIVIGKSAPASPENFNAALGAKLAYEDAIRQLWPLMGFALRQRFYETPAL